MTETMVAADEPIKDVELAEAVAYAEKPYRDQLAEFLADLSPKEVIQITYNMAWAAAQTEFTYHRRTTPEVMGCLSMVTRQDLQEFANKNGYRDPKIAAIAWNALSRFPADVALQQKAHQQNRLNSQQIRELAILSNLRLQICTQGQIDYVDPSSLHELLTALLQQDAPAVRLLSARRLSFLAEFINHHLQLDPPLPVQHPPKTEFDPT